MKLYIKSNTYHSYHEAVSDIYYGPLTTLAEKYRFGVIPSMVLLDFLTDAIEKMTEVGCLDWFLNHYEDSVCATILDNGVEEYTQPEIDSILEEANAEAFAFEEAGYPEVANEIIDHINRAKEEIGDN